MKLRAVLFDRPRPHPKRLNLPVARLYVGHEKNVEDKHGQVDSLVYEDGFVWVGDVGYPISWCRIEREKQYKFEPEPELNLEPVPRPVLVRRRGKIA